MIPGERTQLRRIERTDIPTFVRWFSDPAVREFLLINRPISLVEEESWFEAQLRDQSSEIFAIETLDGTHIGNIGLHDINWVHRRAEMGIVIGEKEYWGRGFGSDAICALLAFAFNEMNLHRIYLQVYEDNERAIQAYKKCGFKLEGTLREAIFRKGTYYDEHIMAVLRSEFAERQDQP